MQRCAVICAIAALARGAGGGRRSLQGGRSPRPSTSSAPRAPSPWPRELKTPSGPVEIKVEYQPPDRMRQTIDGAGSGAARDRALRPARLQPPGRCKWEELMPAVAQTIIAQVRAAVVDPPKDVGNFECLGTTTLDGKEYLDLSQRREAGRCRCRHRRADAASDDLRRSEDGPAGAPTSSPATRPTPRWSSRRHIRLSGEARDRGSPGRPAGENEIGAGPQGSRHGTSIEDER